MSPKLLPTYPHGVENWGMAMTPLRFMCIVKISTQSIKLFLKDTLNLAESTEKKCQFGFECGKNFVHT